MSHGKHPETSLCASQLLSLCSEAQEQQLLSPCAAATEACMPWSPCCTREATTMRNPVTAIESSPLSPQREKSPCSNKDVA